MVAWREKWVAFSLHFLVTLVLCAGAAALVFLVWYPDPFQAMLGGAKLFVILLGCDLALGPLTSLIIYNSKKSRRALLFDYTVVGVVQLAAFVYGIYAVADSRPVYIAFVEDRLEVVAAGELDDEDLARGQNGFRERPKWGPRLIGTQLPQDPSERNELVFLAVAGKDVTVLPAYYVPYEQKLAQIKRRALPVAELAKRHPEAKALISTAAAELAVPVERLSWLPVKHRRGFWTALLDPETARPVSWLPVDPY
jgi:hypothetical protein